MTRKHATTPEQKDFVIEHIKLFPVVESHYCRKSSRRLYLANDIESVAQMHRLYKK